MLSLFKANWMPFTESMEHAREWTMLPSLPAGQHHAVLYPGLATPATSLLLLHLALQRKGVVCHQWGQGFNTGITPEVETKALAHLLGLMQANPGAKWHLIGWSLGGLLARELAKSVSMAGLHCESVTTMGTPINALPNNQRVLAIYKLFNKELPSNNIFLDQTLYVSPPTKSLSIYSRQDLVVPWKTCIQSPDHVGHPIAINQEVSPGHTVMPNHPQTWSILIRWIGGNHDAVQSDHQALAESEARSYWSQRMAA